MARVQYGTIVTEIKGKIAGQVFQRGNKAYVLRNKGYVYGRSSSYRQAANFNLSLMSSVWRRLTDDQRTQWNGAVSTWPFKDKFGNTYYGSGFQMYMAYNAALKSLGVPFVGEPGSPVTPDPPGEVTIIADTVIGFGGIFSITTEIPQYYQVFASPRISQGRNGDNVPLKLIGNIPMDAGSSWLLTDAYVAAWGPIQESGNIVVVTQIRAAEFPYANWITRYVVPITTTP